MPPTSVRIPAWADPQQASVLDSWYQKAARMIGSIIGAADPTAQAMGIAAPVEFPETGALGIRAYHGSPHDFDRFDASKIGTGEGAQSYGHGLYFAEKEGTAQNYRDTFARQMGGKSLTDDMAQIKVGGKQIAPTASRGVDADPAYVELAKAGDSGGLLNAFKAQAERWKAYVADDTYPFRDYAKDKVQSYAAVIGDLERGAKVEAPRARMYEVNIHASPDELLDWDKPLSQQPPKVQEALKNARVIPDWYPEWSAITKRQDEIADLPSAAHKRPEIIAESDALDAKLQALRQRIGQQGQHWVMGPSNQGATGARIYEQLGYGGMGPENSAAQLNSVGIKGIQYLDQGSRAAGQGTRNFVIFPGNEHLIDIARKYGVTLPVAAQMYREMQDRQSHDQPGGIQAHAAQYLK